MIENGGDVNDKQDNDGETTLHMACEPCGEEDSREGYHIKSQFQIVFKLLIENGGITAVVNAKNNNGETPMHRACRYGYCGVLARLMFENGGADVNAKDNDGNTPLHEEACRPYAGWFISEKDEMELVERLIDYGANVNAKNNNGESPLHRACLYGSCFSTSLGVLVALMLKNHGGADVNVQDNNGTTPLHKACCAPTEFDPEYEDSELLELVKLLMEHADGANVNSKDNKNGNNTPLHEACRTEYFLEIVEFLLGKGASADVKTTQGVTPLQIASERNDPEVVWGLLLRQNPWLIVSEQL